MVGHVLDLEADHHGRGSDHASFSSEHGMLSRCRACGPPPGDALSWRNVPQNTVTMQLLSGLLLMCLGILLGAAWAVQACQPKLRRQAEERRRLNEEWLAVRMARREHAECPRCGYLVTGRKR
jgi:hypothetical protein